MEPGTSADGTTTSGDATNYGGTDTAADYFDYLDTAVGYDYTNTTGYGTNYYQPDIT